MNCHLDTIRAYIAALDERRVLANGGCWTNLKGAARTRATAKRQRDLDDAEAALRALLSPEPR